MQVELDNTFPDELRPDLQTVSRDVLAVVRGRMGPEPPEPRPVMCYVRLRGPLTESPPDGATYRVGLSVTTRDYARLAYQLGHELGHVMMDPRRTNGVIETIATALSLQVLDDLQERWTKRPPYASWRAFAPRFGEYRARVETDALSRLPTDVRGAANARDWRFVTGYLGTRSRELAENADARDLQHLAAMVLINNDTPWRQFRNLSALTDPAPARDKRFRDDLPLDLRQAPSALRQIGL